MTVAQLFALMADAAKKSCRAPPVIRTDLESAHLIACAVWEGQGAYYVMEKNEPGVISMFDGIKIVTDRHQPESAAFREHFGILAEIWS